MLAFACADLTTISNRMCLPVCTATFYPARLPPYLCLHLAIFFAARKNFCRVHGLLLLSVAISGICFSIYCPGGEKGGGGGGPTTLAVYRPTVFLSEQITLHLDALLFWVEKKKLSFTYQLELLWSNLL